MNRTLRQAVAVDDAIRAAAAPVGRGDGQGDDDRDDDRARSPPGTACVWKTSRAGASLVWVSMIANRIRTLIAPM